MFEPLEFVLVTEHRRAELLAVDAFRTGCAGKLLFDGFEQCATRPLQLVNGGVGVENRHVEALKHRRDGRLAHADRTGEAENEGFGHWVSNLRSSASCSRGGNSPKNFSNAFAACPISIASPSIVERPLARARLSKSVSTGVVTIS